MTTPPALEKSRCKTDGSETLESLLDDIYFGFCFTSTYRDTEDEELYSTIYETKLPLGTEVYQYDTGTVCQGVIEMLDTSSKVDEKPTTYYELFKIIGIRYEYGEVQYSGKYIIWQYPDSVILTLKATDNKLFFGYSR